jgi:DNA-binding transcriptional regulator YiaG
MTVIDQWTGRHARALQAAMRLTNEAFADHLGVAARTVAKWRERPDMVPSPQLQEALDTAL